MKKSSRAKLDKVRIIAGLVAVCVILVFIVGVTAWTSNLQYQINTINKSIQESERQIQTLEVKIKTSSNITNLEDRALALGLVYPSFDEIKYLSRGSGAVQDLALALMESAYRD